MGFDCLKWREVMFLSRSNCLERSRSSGFCEEKQIEVFTEGNI